MVWEAFLWLFQDCFSEAKMSETSEMSELLSLSKPQEPNGSQQSVQTKTCHADFHPAGVAVQPAKAQVANLDKCAACKGSTYIQPVKPTSK